MTEISKERYLSRLRAMQSMALDSNIQNQNSVAQAKFQQELKKYFEYGFKSEAHLLEVLSDPASNLEIFEDADFCCTVFTLEKKRVNGWIRFLISACAIQQQCIATFAKNQFYIYGPQSRGLNVIWLYRQINEDLERGANQAWDCLSSQEKRISQKRKFKQSYKTMACNLFYSKEYSKREERKRVPIEYKEGLVRSDVLDIDTRSRRFLDSHTKYKKVNKKPKLSDRLGAEAGEKDSSKYSNRRVVSANKALKG